MSLSNLTWSVPTVACGLHAVRALRWVTHLRVLLAKSFNGNYHKLVQSFASFLPMLAYADTGIGPHLFKDGSASFWGDFLSIVGVGLLGFVLLYLMTILFALLHLVLLALILVGVLRGRYWQRGIVVCVLLLSAMYLCLVAVLRSSNHQDLNISAITNERLSLARSHLTRGSWHARLQTDV